MQNYILHKTTPDLFEAMLKSISEAKRTVSIQFMTFEGDSIGLKLSEKLIEAAKRGLEVKVVIDSYTDLILSDEQLFLPHWPSTWVKLFNEFRSTRLMIKNMREAGIQIKRTNPFSFFKPFQFIHHDHRKIVLVDDNRAFIGGFNVSEHNYKWHDTAVEIQEVDVVKAIAEIYKTMFHDLSHQEIIKVNQNAWIIQDNELIMIELERLIEEAKEHVFLESGYFRDKKISELLNSKYEQGIDVKVIVPENNNQSYVQFFQDKLSKAFPNIFHQRTSPDPMTHAKIALIDGTCIFGSSNFEYTDMREIMLFVNNEVLVEQFKSYFNEFQK